MAVQNDRKMAVEHFLGRRRNITYISDLVISDIQFYQVCQFGQVSNFR